VYSSLEFPFGIAVEGLKQWKGRDKLRDKMPMYVEKMKKERGLYN